MTRKVGAISSFTQFGRRALDAISRGVAQIVTKDLKEDVKLSVLDNGFIITIPKKLTMIYLASFKS